MKNLLTIIAAVCLLMCACAPCVLAEETAPTVPYSGAGGSFGNDKNDEQRESSQQTTADDSEGAASFLFDWVYYLIFGGSGVSVYWLYRVKLSKSARNSKKLMNMLDDKDHAWKFNNILTQVKQGFYAVKSAWAAGNMDTARAFLTDDMYEQLKTQLTWLDYRHQHSILKRPKLLDARPVAVFDCPDDACDHVWFYIEWRSISYTVDKYDNSVTNGSTFPKSFEEFWQFTRNGDHWLLSKILQKDEAQKVIFGEEPAESTGRKQY